MLVIVLTIDFNSRYGPGRILKTQSFKLCPFLTLSVRNGPSVCFATNVPCISLTNKKQKVIYVANKRNTCMNLYLYVEHNY